MRLWSFFRLYAILILMNISTGSATSTPLSTGSLTTSKLSASQKGLAPILIVLLIAAAVGGYFIYQNQIKPTLPPITQPTPSQIAAPAPTDADTTVNTEASRSANWKTYTNSKYGFSLKYPAGYVIKEDGSGVIQIADSEKSFTELSNFITIDPRLVGMYANYANAIQKAREQFKNDTIENTENGIKFTSKPYTLPFVNNGKQQLYRLNVYYMYQGGAMTTTFNNEPINNIHKYDQILSTFKFLD